VIPPGMQEIVLRWNTGDWDSLAVTPAAAARLASVLMRPCERPCWLRRLRPCRHLALQYLAVTDDGEQHHD
jgi:hypothetical protein